MFRSPQFKEDFDFGTAKEKSEIQVLREKFHPMLKKIEDNYFVFDFGCKNCYVELKSRRCAHDKYEDTMVSMNKIEYASHTERPVYFCFSFTDGIYFWQYNKEDLENGNVEIRKGGRTDRGVDEIKDYAFIKNKILTKI